MKKVEDLKVGDTTVFFDGGFFELTKTNSWIEEIGGRRVLVVEAVVNGDIDEASRHLEKEFGYPVEIRQK